MNNKSMSRAVAWVLVAIMLVFSAPLAGFPALFALRANAQENNLDISHYTGDLQIFNRNSYNLNGQTAATTGDIGFSLTGAVQSGFPVNILVGDQPNDGDAGSQPQAHDIDIQLNAMSLAQYPDNPNSLVVKPVNGGLHKVNVSVVAASSADALVLEDGATLDLSLDGADLSLAAVTLGAGSVLNLRVPIGRTLSLGTVTGTGTLHITGGGTITGSGDIACGAITVEDTTINLGSYSLLADGTMTLTNASLATTGSLSATGNVTASGATISSAAFFGIDDGAAGAKTVEFTNFCALNYVAAVGAAADTNAVVTLVGLDYLTTQGALVCISDFALNYEASEIPLDPAGWASSFRVSRNKDGSNAATLGTTADGIYTPGGYTLPALSPDGYAHLGWRIGEGETLNVLPMTGLLSDTLLTAVLEAGAVTVKYDLDYTPTSLTNEPDENAFTNPHATFIGNTITLPAPVRFGYAFTGWLVEGTETLLPAGDYIVAYKDTDAGALNLVAQWTAKQYDLKLKLGLELAENTYKVKIRFGDGEPMALSAVPAAFPGVLYVETGENATLDKTLSFQNIPYSTTLEDYFEDNFGGYPTLVYDGTGGTDTRSFVSWTTVNGRAVYGSSVFAYTGADTSGVLDDKGAKTFAEYQAVLDFETVNIVPTWGTGEFTLSLSAVEGASYANWSVLADGEPLTGENGIYSIRYGATVALRRSVETETAAFWSLSQLGGNTSILLTEQANGGDMPTDYTFTMPVGHVSAVYDTVFDTAAGDYDFKTITGAGGYSAFGVSITDDDSNVCTYLWSDTITEISFRSSAPSTHQIKVAKQITLNLYDVKLYGREDAIAVLDSTDGALYNVRGENSGKVRGDAYYYTSTTGRDEANILFNSNIDETGTDNNIQLTLNLYGENEIYLIGQTDFSNAATSGNHRKLTICGANNTQAALKTSSVLWCGVFTSTNIDYSDIEGARGEFIIHINASAYTVTDCSIVSESSVLHRYAGNYRDSSGYAYATTYNNTTIELTDAALYGQVLTLNGCSVVAQMIVTRIRCLFYPSTTAGVTVPTTARAGYIGYYLSPNSPSNGDNTYMKITGGSEVVIDGSLTTGKNGFAAASLHMNNGSLTTTNLWLRSNIILEAGSTATVSGQVLPFLRYNNETTDRGLYTGTYINGRFYMDITGGSVFSAGGINNGAPFGLEKDTTALVRVDGADSRLQLQSNVELYNRVEVSNGAELLMSDGTNDYDLTTRQGLYVGTRRTVITRTNQMVPTFTTSETSSAAIITANNLYHSGADDLIGADEQAYYHLFSFSDASTVMAQNVGAKDADARVDVVYSRGSDNPLGSITGSVYRDIRLLYIMPGGYTPGSNPESIRLVNDLFADTDVALELPVLSDPAYPASYFAADCWRVGEQQISGWAQNGTGILDSANAVVFPFAQTDGLVTVRAVVTAIPTELFADDGAIQSIEAWDDGLNEWVPCTITDGFVLLPNETDVRVTTTAAYTGRVVAADVRTAANGNDYYPVPIVEAQENGGLTHTFHVDATAMKLCVCNEIELYLDSYPIRVGQESGRYGFWLFNGTEAADFFPFAGDYYITQRQNDVPDACTNNITVDFDNSIAGTPAVTIEGVHVPGNSDIDTVRFLRGGSVTLAGANSLRNIYTAANMDLSIYFVPGATLTVKRDIFSGGSAAHFGNRAARSLTIYGDDAGNDIICENLYYTDTSQRALFGGKTITLNNLRVTKRNTTSTDNHAVNIFVAVADDATFTNCHFEYFLSYINDNQFNAKRMTLIDTDLSICNYNDHGVSGYQTSPYKNLSGDRELILRGNSTVNFDTFYFRDPLPLQEVTHALLYNHNHSNNTGVSLDIGENCTMNVQYPVSVKSVTVKEGGTLNLINRDNTWYYPLACRNILCDGGTINAASVFVSGYTTSGSDLRMNSLGTRNINTGFTDSGTLTVQNGGVINAHGQKITYYLEDGSLPDLTDGYIGGSRGAVLDIQDGTLNADKVGSLDFLIGLTQKGVPYRDDPLATPATINLTDGAIEASEVYGNLTVNGGSITDFTQLGGAGSTVTVNGGTLLAPDGAIDVGTGSVTVTGGRLHVRDILAQGGTADISTTSETPVAYTDADGFANPYYAAHPEAGNPFVGVRADGDIAADTLTINKGAVVYANNAISDAAETGSFNIGTDSTGAVVSPRAYLYIGNEFGATGTGDIAVNIDDDSYPYGQFLVNINYVLLDDVLSQAAVNADGLGLPDNSANPFAIQQNRFYDNNGISEQYYVLQAPTRTGYNFLGWFTEPTGDTDDPITRIDTTTPNTVRLYARWERQTVRFAVEVTAVAAGGAHEFLDLPGGTYDADTQTFTYTLLGESAYLDTIFSAEADSKIHITDYKTVTKTAFRMGIHAYAGTYEGTPYTIPEGVLNPATATVTLDVLNAYLDRGEPLRIYISDLTITNALISLHLNRNARGLPIDAKFPGLPAAQQTLSAVVEFGQSLVSSSALVPDGDLIEPTAVGYTFGGWYTDPACTGNPVTAADLVNAESPKSFYAKWTANKYIIGVTFDAGEGAVVSADAPQTGEAQRKFRYESAYDQPIGCNADGDPVELFDAWKPGYRFDGWRYTFTYYDEDDVPHTILGDRSYTTDELRNVDLSDPSVLFLNNTDFPDINIATTHDSLVVFAAEYTKTTVHYELNGGTIVNPAHEDTYGEPLLGYTINTQASADYDILGAATADVYSFTDGENDAVTVSTAPFTYGVYSTTSLYYSADGYHTGDYREDLSRKGYTFLGWYATQEDAAAVSAGNTTIAPAVVSALYADTTLWAAWSANTYGVTIENYKPDFAYVDGVQFKISTDGENFTEGHAVISQDGSTQVTVGSEIQNLDDTQWPARSLWYTTSNVTNDHRYLLGFTFNAYDPGINDSSNAAGYAAYNAYSSIITELIADDLLFTKHEQATAGSIFKLADSVPDYPAGSVIPLYGVYREISLVFIERYTDTDSVTHERTLVAYHWDDYVDVAAAGGPLSRISPTLAQRGYTLINWRIGQPTSGTVYGSDTYGDTNARQEFKDDAISVGSYDIRVYTFFAAQVTRTGVLHSNPTLVRDNALNSLSFVIPGSMQTGLLQYQLTSIEDGLHIVRYDDLTPDFYFNETLADNTIALKCELIQPNGTVVKTGSLTSTDVTPTEVSVSTGWSVRITLYHSKVIATDRNNVGVTVKFTFAGVADQWVTEELTLSLAKSEYLVSYDLHLPEPIENLTASWQDGTALTETAIEHETVRYGESIRVASIEGYTSPGWQLAGTTVPNTGALDFAESFTAANGKNGEISLETSWMPNTHILHVDNDLQDKWTAAYTDGYTEEATPAVTQAAYGDNQVKYHSTVTLAPVGSQQAQYLRIVCDGVSYRLDEPDPAQQCPYLTERDGNYILTMPDADVEILYSETVTLYLERSDIILNSTQYTYRGVVYAWNGDYNILLDDPTYGDTCTETENTISVESTVARAITLGEMKITAADGIRLAAGAGAEITLAGSLDVRNIAVPETAILTLTGDGTQAVTLAPAANNAGIGGRSSGGSGNITLANLAIAASMDKQSVASVIGPATATAPGGSITVNGGSLTVNEARDIQSAYGGTWLGGGGVGSVSVTDCAIRAGGDTVTTTQASNVANGGSVTLTDCAIDTVYAPLKATESLTFNRTHLNQVITNNRNTLEAPVIHVIESTIESDCRTGFYTGTLFIEDALSDVRIGGYRLAEVNNGDIEIRDDGYTQAGQVHTGTDESYYLLDEFTEYTGGSNVTISDRNSANSITLRSPKDDSAFRIADLTVSCDAPVLLQAGNHVEIANITIADAADTLTVTAGTGSTLALGGFTDTNGTYVQTGGTLTGGDLGTDSMTIDLTNTVVNVTSLVAKNLSLDGCTVTATGAVGSRGAQNEVTTVAISGTTAIDAANIGALGAANETFTLVPIGDGFSYKGTLVRDCYRIDYAMNTIDSFTHTNNAVLRTTQTNDNMAAFAETEVAYYPAAAADLLKTGVQTVEFKTWYLLTGADNTPLAVSEEPVDGYAQTTGLLPTSLASAAPSVVTANADGTSTLTLKGDVIFRAESVTLSPAEIVMDIDTTQSISAIVLPDETTNKEVLWASEDPNIASVDASGVVTANGVGIVNITATSADNNALVGFCAVTVVCPHESDHVTWVIDTPATCETDGAGHNHCSRCNADYHHAVIPATGHSYSDWGSNDNGTHTKVCPNAGCEDPTVTENCTYTHATYEPIDTARGYTRHTCNEATCGYFYDDTFTWRVTFAAGDNGTLSSFASAIVADDGFLTSVPTPQANTGYHFNDWSPSDPETTQINSAVTFTATFAINSYTIQFYDYDSTLKQESDWDHFTQPVYDAVTNGALEIAPTIEHVYEFAGWSTVQNAATAAYTDATLPTVTGPAAYYAVYTEDLRPYTVTYAYGAHCTQTGITTPETVLYSNTPEQIPTDTVLNGYVHTGYHFDRWMPEAPGAAITGDITYTATYAPNSYSIILSAPDATPQAHEASATATFDAALPAITDVPSRTYAVGFNANGGEAVEDMTVVYAFDGYFLNGFRWYKGDGSAVETPWTTDGGATLTADWSGGTITLPATTRPGYTFAGWYLDGESVGMDGETYAAAANVTLLAAWTYDATQWATVTYIAGENGSVSGETTKTVVKGTAYDDAWRPTATANDGYVFDAWTNEPTTVTEDVTVTAAFAYDATQWATVTYTAGENGSVSGVLTKTVVKGTAYDDAWRPTATANDGYVFSAWTNEPETVTTDVTITATFAYDADQWATVTYIAGENGSVSGVLTKTVVKGTAYDDAWRPTATANDGYVFDAWTNEPETVTEDVIVTAAFAYDADQWATVTYIAGENGSVSGTLTKTVVKGTTYDDAWRPTATANDGYVFSAWTNEPETVTEDVTVTAAFAYDATQWADVIYFYGANSINPGGVIGTEHLLIGTTTQAVPTDEELQAAAAAGYCFDEWTPSDPNGATVAGDIEYIATYAVDANNNDIPDDDPEETWHTVTFTVGEHSDMAGTSTSILVLRHTMPNPASIPNATADFGYHFVSWTTNGTAVDPASVLITGDTSFLMHFAPNSYAAVVELPDHTTGDCPAEAVYDTDYVFTIIPADGYLLPAEIEISIGGQVLEESDYTYDPVSGDVVIAGDQIIDGTIVVSGTVGFYIPAVSLTVLHNGLAVDEVNHSGGDPVQLTAVVLPAEASYPDVTWTTSNPAIATVDQNGRVHIHSIGSVIITATHRDGPTDDITIHISGIHVTELFFAESVLRVPVGSSRQANVTVLPASATFRAVNWTIADPSIATVDANGVVTGVGVGHTTLTATSVEGGKTAVIDVYTYAAGSAYVANFVPSPVGDFLIGGNKFNEYVPIAVNAGQTLRFQFAVKRPYNPAMLSVTVNGRLLPVDAENYFTIPCVYENITIVVVYTGSIEVEEPDGGGIPDGDTCWCHSSNAIIRFIWKIVCFFAKLFKLESFHYCACGAAHW